MPAYEEACEDEACKALDDGLRAAAFVALQPRIDRLNKAQRLGPKMKTEDERWALVHWVSDGGPLPELVSAALRA